MKKIIIKNQDEFNDIKIVAADEEVVFDADKIVFNAIIEVYGILRLKGEIKTERGKHIEARESSQVYNVAMASSQVYNVAMASSQVYNVAMASSQVHNVAWASSQVHNVAWESSQVYNEAWESSQVHCAGNVTTLKLFGFSVASLPFGAKIKKITKAKTAKVQRYKFISDYFEREGIVVKRGICVLYKRVSSEYKTQEGTENETLWMPGITVIHKRWNPKNSECGAGKFHAVSHPYFGDEFRSNIGDRYVAIKIKISDTYQWPNPTYPHKIGFREGTVLYECDKYGIEVRKAK